MSFPHVTARDWRAQVDKELAGTLFEKALIHRTAEGLPIQPLYTEAPPGAGPIGADAQTAPFRICVRLDVAARAEVIAEELAGGADALWLDSTAGDVAFGAGGIERVFLVLECGGVSPMVQLDRLSARLAPDAAFALASDPLADVARGRLAPSGLAEARDALVQAARAAEGRWPRASVATASTLPYHDAGADAADEIAIALATGTAYLESLVAGGFSPAAAARHVTLRTAAGRDTFGEMCKLRALRIVWRKVLVAVGAAEAPRALLHAVCSSRTLTQRDPWVNMLRATTQVFAAVLGGADLVTPTVFDEALGPASPLGRRVARNTGLVLREESALGKVKDAPGGSYYFDSLTDALAREGWKRFQGIEREGGIEEALVSGRLRAKIESSWSAWLARIATRKAGVLGVSEFANLDEKLPRPARETEAPSPDAAALPVHRDAEIFEALRLRADVSPQRPEGVLVALGPFAESRSRVGFASNFFAAGGIRMREVPRAEAAAIACLCGSDERYAAEAVDQARTLKTAGCRRVLLAGRPGPLEPALREAGVDGFLYAGCDALALLSELLDAFR
jgi:methylmalonyl-CoA mutase